MNVDELVRASLREQADAQQPLGPGFAERVLTVRRRRRTHTLAAAAAATAAVVAIAVAVPLLGPGKDDPPLASRLDRGDVIAHPEQSPPRDLITAGGTAVAAYYTSKNVKSRPGWEVSRRTYAVLDQKTGTYVKDTRWSYLAVAPGMRTAAVLERGLPAERIGLLDLLTGRIRRWIPVDHRVGGVAFSPDGGKLLATTYSADPDLHFHQQDPDPDGDGVEEPVPDDSSKRTGFYLIDVDSGKGSWRRVSYDPAAINSRQDFGFSADGKLVFSGVFSAPYQQYYDFEGHEVATPANERHLLWYVEARLSPNGRLAAGDFAGSGHTTASEIVDPRTGKRLYKVPGQQLLAWADDRRLIAWDITPGTNEFHNRLVLVTIGEKKTVPLSGFRQGNDITPGRWTPVFAKR